MLLNLFTTYFLHNKKERKEEIEKCIEVNINNPNIHRIFLFTENVSSESVMRRFGRKKIDPIRLDRRPTYLDWIRMSSGLDSGDISVLCNSDIYFDDTIRLMKSFLSGPERMVCLTRHEFHGGEVVVHEHPEWSQDVWAIRAGDARHLIFQNQTEIEMGFPACDNKLACVFAAAGWDLYNPYESIRCFHLHDSQIRDYEKYSVQAAGFLGFVGLSRSPEDPSEVRIALVPPRMTNIKSIGINYYLAKRLNRTATQSNGA